MEPVGQPGAGLPGPELFFIKRILVPLVRRFFSWESALKMLLRESGKIRALTEQLPPELLIRQVLVEKVFAIEHHTRTFSAAMVMEHLAVTGAGVQMIVETLGKEKEFLREVTIQGVKPKENQPDALEKLLLFTQGYESFIGNLEKRVSKATQPHPWFGPFTNFDWHCLMALHTFIHRRQIEAILKNVVRQT